MIEGTTLALDSGPLLVDVAAHTVEPGDIVVWRGRTAEPGRPDIRTSGVPEVRT